MNAKLEIDSIYQNEEKISSIVNITETLTRIQVNLTLIKDNLKHMRKNL